MSYRKALERLKAYEPKRLIRGSYCLNGECCAMGAILPDLRAGGFRDYAVVLMAEENECLRDDLHRVFDSATEHNRIVNRNDAYNGTPKGRYRHMVKWLTDQVAMEDAK